MSDPDRFPDPLQSSAVPRWSHRDPVEGGNPFEPDDDRHQLWHRATDRARDALVRLDADLRLEPTHQHPDRYPARVVGLAVARFDVWARRALPIVRNRRALADYERWLEGYRENWLEYVGDTCPKIDLADELGAQLAARLRVWIERGRCGLSDHDRHADRSG